MSKAGRTSVFATLCVLCVLFFVATLVPAQQSDQSNAKVASLQDQLEKGLKARRPVEFEFIGRVVQLVDQRRLTREVVQGTFGFVIKKYGSKKYLVPIFEQTLRKRVTEDGNTALNNVPTTLR